MWRSWRMHKANGRWGSQAGKCDDSKRCWILQMGHWVNHEQREVSLPSKKGLWRKTRWTSHKNIDLARFLLMLWVPKTQIHSKQEQVVTVRCALIEGSADLGSLFSYKDIQRNLTSVTSDPSDDKSSNEPVYSKDVTMNFQVGQFVSAIYAAKRFCAHWIPCVRLGRAVVNFFSRMQTETK